VTWSRIALILLLVSGCRPEPTSEAPSRLGLWVLSEGTHRTLESPDRVDRLAENAQALGVTDLLLQVYRGGRSWFRSTHADDTPAREIEANLGLDTIGRTIERAHARGMRVHAWFNALSLARNRDAPLVQHVGPQAVLVDRRGRSLLDYPDLEVPSPDRKLLRMGTPGVWLDPATPGVIEYLERTVDDLVRAAPDLDGLHLDFIRHPMVLPLVPGSRFDVGLDFGYGPESIRRFEGETGEPFRRGSAWDAFRRAQVDAVVRRLCARVPETWECSAAVVAYADRAYLTAMQDYRQWLEAGWLDFAVAMAYTRDDRLLRLLSHELRGGVAGGRVWIGLGSWLYVKNLEGMLNQVALARDADPSGLALFSYDALVDAPEALDALIASRAPAEK
jgi:uncharacterized lipoprotein YddW (UPF0748 family)